MNDPKTPIEPSGEAVRCSDMVRHPVWGIDMTDSDLMALQIHARRHGNAPVQITLLEDASENRNISGLIREEESQKPTPNQSSQADSTPVRSGLVALMRHILSELCSIRISWCGVRMPNDPSSPTAEQNAPPVNQSADGGSVQRMVRHQSQNESVAACSDLHTSSLPVSAYDSDGLLTFSGMLLTMEDCSFENWFAGRTPQMRKWGKQVLARWRESGYPSLGDAPPDNSELRLLDYSLGVMCGVMLMPNDPKMSDPAKGDSK